VREVDADKVPWFGAALISGRSMSANLLNIKENIRQMPQ
jgi:hypothetical protein